MALQGSDLTTGLQTRLSSTLPLEVRCRLAVNTFTSNVFIPRKEEVVLDWLMTSLDLKYRDRLSPSLTPDDTLLWDTLHTCLAHMATAPTSPPYKFSTVPDILLNILPHTDMSLATSMSCISHLITLSSKHSPTHPNWSNLLSLLISSTTADSSPSLITSLHTAIQRITLDPTQDHSPLLIQLSALNLSHPHPSLQQMVSSLLFPTPDPYTPLFSHLSGVDGKYHPCQVTSILLSSLSSGCSPLLVMSSCPAQPPWLRAKLFSVLLSTQGCTGLVDSSTVEGGKLLKCLTKKIVFEGSSLFRLALPLDLSLELAPGYTMAKSIQDVVKELVVAEGVTEEIADILDAVHEHHPQVLEPLVALILVKHLEKPSSVGNVFKNLMDVMMKLRQLPKLISKLFLHLRTSSPVSPLCWAESDLEMLGSALGSLPRVQYLEMWKSINYHLSSDIVSGTSGQADQFAAVLSPILSTVLLNSQLADHNLPSSLLPRIQDLMDNTLTSLEIVFNMDNISSKLKQLVVEASYALSELSTLFVEYRGLKQFGKQLAFAQGVAARVGAAQDWQDSPAARRLQVSFCQENKSTEKVLGDCEEAFDELESTPDIIGQIPDPTLLKIVRTKTVANNLLYESPRFCSAVIFTLLAKWNKQENFFIPEFEHWANFADSLDSYLGKSLASCFTTLMHSELPGSELGAQDLEVLGKLPLENLPTVLKLGATLVCLGQVYRQAKSRTQSFMLAARCLETTDLFRFVDAGKFLNQMLAHEDVTDEIIEVVAKSAGRFTKTIKDIDNNFHEFEENVRNENNLHLKACVCLLNSLNMSLSEGAEGTDKKVAGKALADKISKHVVKIFKKKNLDNSEQIEALCVAAAELVKMYSKTGLGKMSKLVHKMVELSLSETCRSWITLLGEICKNFDHLEADILPEDWKLSCWKVLSDNFEEDCQALVKSLFKIATPSELEQMLKTLLDNDLVDLSIWKCIISSEVTEDCMNAKKAAVEEAVAAACKQARAVDYEQLDKLPEFFTVIFSSSPPCVSTQLEIVCLGSLLSSSTESASSSLSALSTFLSHRGTLSTRTIPITTLIIRNCISPSPSVLTLHALQKVLGLFSRHKADYSSVLPHLVADILHLMSSSSPQSKTILTTSLHPLLDMLDKHSFEYLSSNLAPATNEIFKRLLTNYNSSHKFKGKV
eukprot:TRINITY_DN3695_c0_g1_i1.p1 TRINITY_DN3695_c0_g1~~TRINITY_DN3695_c0_g1_i1.p1  ORF type:complete len:1178 (+),score=297.53 TRINITY_DN3695_c0_g1_i1:54-3587(+)